MMKGAVAGPFKPGLPLLIQVLDGGEQSSTQEVALHVLDHILHLPFTLGVGLAAEDTLEVLLVLEASEAFGQYQVTQVLITKQHLVLVVDDPLRLAAKILESKLMGIDCQGRIERDSAEIYKLVAGPAQDHGEEIYLDGCTIGRCHVALAEIHLR